MAEPALYFVLTGWSAQAHKTIEVYLRRPEALAPQELDQARALLTACFDLASRGAFPAGLLVPDVGAVDLVPGEALSDHAVGLLFELSDVDYRVCHIACNVLGHAIAGLRGVEFREVIEPDTQVQRQNWRLPASRDDADMQGFPPMASWLPFQVLPEDAADRVKGRRCLVTMSQAVEAPELASLVRAMDDWACLLEMGGYSSTALGSTVILGSLHAYDDYGVEMVISIFEASEAAWFSLLNLLRNFPAGAAVIADVCIE